MSSPLPEDGWPEGALYHSPRGLYPFQVDGIARMYVMGSGLLVWDTGTGKSHAAMRLATVLFEDDETDLVLLVAEKGKVGEWKDDFQEYTRLETRVHHGSGRMQRLERKGMPQVLVTTYETAKADLARFVRTPGGRGTSVKDGPLLEAIRPLRVAIFYDEIPVKLRKRSSGIYKAHQRALKELRKVHPTEIRAWGLTATPLERDYEDAFNQMRIVRPDLMPTVAEFERVYVQSRDLYNRPTYHPTRILDFAAICQQAIIRKRKSDPDVIDQFPKRVEEAMHIHMADDQRRLYETIESLQDDQEEPIPGLWTVLRQFAGAPSSLLYSSENPEGSKLAKIIVDEIGADVLRACSSAKEEELLHYLDMVVKGQGAKAVVFTFFGQSVLRVLHRRLTESGFKVYLNHGQMTMSAQTESRKSFRADPEPCVFLTSDAGARGINLPEGTYVVEYESALSYANRTQRLDRVHRIDSIAESVTCMTLFLDGTVEESIGIKMIDRNEQTDILLGDEDAGENFMTAEERKAALRIARTPRNRKRSS
jgi:SNF2 family DNA or RNA helicase